MQTPKLQLEDVFYITQDPNGRRYTGRSSFFEQVKSGLWTKPVKIGTRSSVWPSHEVDQLIQARIAGKSKEEIKALVIQLEAARQVAA